MFGKQRQTGRIVMTVLAVCLIAAASIAVYSLRDSLFAQNNPETGTPTTGSTTAPTTARTVREAADPVTNVPDTRTTAPTTEVQSALYVLPVSNTVAAAFSREPVHSETMGDWRTHNGVDIAAKAGTTVLAACAGAVQTVTEDPLLGTTVVLEHDGGYQTTYANLQADPGVEVGEAVSAGQIIGAVGTTAPGEDGTPHLHFAVTLDGKAVDPGEFLEQ